MTDQDETSVASVCEFTGLDPIVDRDLVVSALKEKTGSVEAVVAAFYDDEVKFRQMFTWDEAHFLTERDGTSNDVGLPTFNVQGPGDGHIIHGISPTGHHLGAPSRPPSRAQSPLGRMVNWTAQTNPASAFNLQSEEDTELQRAMAASVSSLQSPQETGVTGGDTDTSLPFFGPASRETYDLNQWAMVRATTDNQEPGPSARRRTPGTPAFLRCRKERGDAYNLNALLTILHSVPGVRNAMLQSGYSAHNYGQNSEWWKGSFLSSTSELSQDATSVSARNLVSGTSTTSDHARGFSEEIHRIMAFLDDTDRAYGTADNFSNAKLLGEAWDDNSDRLFFNFFREVNPPNISEKLFSDIGLVAVSDKDDCAYTESYAILDVKAERGQYFGELRDIYNLLDTVYWPDLGGASLEPIATARMAESTRLGMVQIFSICIDGLQQPIELPEFFFPDRYMAENRQLALQLQLQLRSVYLALKKSDELCDKIASFMDKSSNFRLSQVTLSEQAIGLGMQKLWQLKAASFWKQHEASVGNHDEFDFSLADVDTTELVTPEDSKVAKAIQAEIAVHRKKLADIDNKLQRLRKEKGACEKLLRQLRLRNTGPDIEDGWGPTHRYRLRGIIVSRNTFYMCRRETETDGELLPDGVDQWWRISFDSSASEPLCVERSTIAAAQEAAFRDASKSTVIYASDAAIDETPAPLPDPLRTFVRFDNRVFKQELAEEGQREKKRMPTESPTSPSKRQQRSDSIDSMATNKASLDDLSDRDMSDAPFVAERFIVDDAFMDASPEAGGKSHSHDHGDVHGSVRATLQNHREAEKEGSLGTEMVQLAISRPSEKTPADPIRLTGNETSFGLEDDVPSGTEGETGGKNNTSLLRRYEGQPKKETSPGQIHLVADWDYPEGRYAGSIDSTREPRDH